jgi:hypothetical protein
MPYYGPTNTVGTPSVTLCCPQVHIEVIRAIGSPPTNTVGAPVTITEAEQMGLNPGIFGLTGLPCGLIIDPTLAAGSIIGPTSTVGNPEVMVPGPSGSNGNPVTEAGKPMTAAGNGIT